MFDEMWMELGFCVWPRLCQGPGAGLYVWECATQLHNGDVRMSLSKHQVEKHLPLLIAILYVASGDYLSLVRQLRLIV